MNKKSKPTFNSARLAAARDFVAELVAVDPIYLPIFIRLENEVEITEAQERGDALAVARGLARAGGRDVKSG